MSMGDACGGGSDESMVCTVLSLHNVATIELRGLNRANSLRRFGAQVYVQQSRRLRLTGAVLPHVAFQLAGKCVAVAGRERCGAAGLDTAGPQLIHEIAH